MSTSNVTLAQKLCLAAFLLPLTTLIVCLLLLWYISPTDACIPWLAHCVGVWQIGIPDPISFVFRAGMFATVVVWWCWWYSMKAWLLLTSPTLPMWSVRHCLFIAGLACMGLAIAIALLRPDAQNIPWQFQSSAAAVFWIAMSLAQSRTMHWLKRQQSQPWLNGAQLLWPKRLVNMQWLLLGAYLVLSVAQLEWQKTLEWWLLLVMSAFWLSFWPQWRHFRLVMAE